MAQEEQETEVVPVIRAGLCLVNTAAYLTDEGISDVKSANRIAWCRCRCNDAIGVFVGHRCQCVERTAMTHVGWAMCVDRVIVFSSFRSCIESCGR